MANEPITLNIKKSDREIYNNILENSPLKGRSNKEAFLLAAVVGFKKGQRISISGNKESYVRTEYLNDDDRVLINAIAIKETEKIEIIQDKKEVFNIIEEYAHGGLISLKEMVFDKDAGSFLKKFEAYLREECLPPEEKRK